MRVRFFYAVLLLMLPGVFGGCSIVSGFREVDFLPVGAPKGYVKFLRSGGSNMNLFVEYKSNDKYKMLGVLGQPYSLSGWINVAVPPGENHFRIAGNNTSSVSLKVFVPENKLVPVKIDLSFVGQSGRTTRYSLKHKILKSISLEEAAEIYSENRYIDTLRNVEFYNKCEICKDDYIDGYNHPAVGENLCVNCIKKIEGYIKTRDNLEKVIHMTDIMLKKNNKASSVYYLRALAYMDMKQKEKALDAVKKGLDVNPEDKHCVELNEKLNFDPSLYLEKAQQLMDEGEYFKALKPLDKILMKALENEKASFLKAVSLFNIGQHDFASIYFARLVKLYPENQMYREKIKELFGEKEIIVFPQSEKRQVFLQNIYNGSGKFIISLNGDEFAYLVKDARLSKLLEGTDDFFNEYAAYNPDILSESFMTMEQFKEYMANKKK